MARRATKVLFVTQQFDPDHPALGTTIPQLTALARLVDELVIVADTIVPDLLPPNARAHSFRSRTKLGRGLRFYAALARELGGLRGGGAVIAHMCPVYAVLAAPLVRPAGVPLVLWYTHWKDHWVVRAAERLCTAVVSVDRLSFPFASRKLVATGQAIDVAHFPPRADSGGAGPLRVVVLGRYSPAKGLETVLRAMRLALDAGVDLRVELHGPAFNELERDYRAGLEPLVAELGLGDRVELGDAVGRDELPQVLARSDVLVNNARRRRPDRLRGRGERDPGDRVQPCAREPVGAGRVLRPRRRAGARGSPVRHGGDTGRRAGRARPEAARARRPRALGRLVVRRTAPRRRPLITIAELRRRVVFAQGYAGRFRRGRAADVVETVRRLGCVQLDSISTVDRSHRIALTSRVGFYPAGTVSRLLREGRIFEYWAHEACLLPIEDFAMHRWRMNRMRESGLWGRGTIEERPELAEEVLAAIRERGALGSRHFDGRGAGGMWNWKPAKEMLETLFAAGELVCAGRDGFQRLYDLPERVIPREQLDAPTATEDEYLRWAVLRGVEARGALTEAALAEMWRLRGGVARVRPHVAALVAEERLERLEVEDGGSAVFVPAGSQPGDAAATSVLLSPFDNLVWDRAFLERVFGFRHVIEVYKREPERIYGYYVLPLLRRDRLVGRADLKTDRAEGVLRLKAFHREPRVRASGALDAALERALDRLARCLGLSSAVAEEAERLAALHVEVDPVDGDERAEALDEAAGVDERETRHDSAP